MKRIINSISFLVTLSAAMLLLASAVVIYVRPEKIHVFTFMGILFPAVWMLNVIFFVLHGLRMKKRALIPLFVILLTWTQWTNIFQWSGSQAPEKMNQPVKVMTYNARMFDFYNWSGQPGILDAILDFIRKENPDVLCVQEFFTSTREEKYIPHRIIARLNALGFRHIEYSVKGPRDSGYGIATFSRFPIVNKGKLRFENSKNMSIFTDVDISGKVIRIFNNHLESIGLEASEYKTLDSLNFQINEKQNNGLKKIFQKMSRAFRFRSDQAETVARHIANSPYPVLVCGDFNDTPVSYVYRTMRGDLKDAFRESGSGFGGTYHGRLPSLRIDYIFYAPQFSVYDFHTFRVPYSDHYPIMCTIELAPEGGP